MKKLVYKQTLSCLFLFANLLVVGQNSYEPSVTPMSLTLEGKSLEGYSSHFDFDRESVRYGWWDYARDFGSPLNMKSYYKVTIPSKTTDGNTDLLIFTQTTAAKGGVNFFLGVEEEKFKDQAKQLLLDFKKRFYIDQVLKQISAKKDEAKKLSDEYEDVLLEDKRKEILNQITIIREEIELLKSEIRDIEGQ